MKTLVNIKILFSVIMVMMFATACNNYISKEEHEKQMNDLVVEQKQQRDAVENLYNEDIRDIQSDLTKVRSAYSDLIVNSYTEGDIQMSKKDKAIADINQIASLLQDNKAKIAKLEKKLAKSNKNSKEVTEALNIAKSNLAQQELQLADVKRMLKEKDDQIADLNNKMVEQDSKIVNLQQNITDNTIANNKTYLAVGTPRELKEKHIIASKGGLLGIKKVDVLSNDVDKKDFEVLDKTVVTSIPLGGTKPVLVTQHPKESYEITSANEGQLATLTIKDPQEFWSLSKYLVVEVKQ